MSYEYFARPDTFNGPSMREIRLPIRLRLSGSGHLYSAIVAPSFRPNKACSLCGSGTFRHLHHCASNTGIGAAAADVPTQTGLHVFERWMWISIKESLASNDKAGCAKAALLRVVVNECLLHRMQLVAVH